MVSKSSATHTVRVPNELWQWLAEEAGRRGTTANNLVCDLLLVGRLKAEEAKVAASNPTQEPKPLRSQDKPAEKAAEVKPPSNPPRAPAERQDRLTMEDVRPRIAPGSRLKSPKR